MLQVIVKLAKRFAVFIPGIIIAYVSFRFTLPFFDKRLPDSIAILVTYALAAYIFIPALIRTFRIFFPPKHLPLYCITPDGFASDPLNIGLICRRHELILTMEKAGWFIADPHNPKYIIKHLLSLFFDWEYNHAPVSNLYLFGRKQDLAFEKFVKDRTTSRHHVRFWATTFDGNKPLSARSIHWHNRKRHVQADELLWVGAASLDIGVVPIRHNLQLTHMVDPDTNKERELIINQIQKIKKIKKIEDIKLDDPYRLVNRTWRGELNTDGKMRVIWLN
ncbi:MAG TPA: LssY C-terminal domain-containing protein [Patescibacteria group bacterium]|nr:LssY C-terminal domain-containing protein [Patescibacteria group bacterium]